MVQTYITGKVANYFSEKLNTTIRIEGVDISWRLNGVIEGLYVEDQKGEVLAQLQRLEFGLKKYDGKKTFIELSRAEIEDLYFAVRVYKGEEKTNLQFLIDYFSPPDDSKESKPFHFGIQKVKLKRGRFIYQNQNSELKQEGMDYAYLDVDSIYLNAKFFAIDSSDYSADILHLAAIEKSGFELDTFSGNTFVSPLGARIENMRIKTPNSDLYVQLGLEYDRWSQWLDFIDSVRFDSQIDSCSLRLEDLKPFSPSLDKTNLILAASGKVKGSVANLHLRKFRMNTGQKTSFDGKVNITGLPDINASFIDVKANELVSDYSDIVDLVLPGGSKIKVPEQIAQLKKIKIKGRFTGFYNDFVSNASFQTAMGNMKTDLLIKPRKDNFKLTYEGKIKLSNFDLGSLFSMDGINQISLSGEIDGKGVDENAEANANIHISKIKIADYLYYNSHIKGELKNKNVRAKVVSQDSVFRLVADGAYNFADTLPRYDFFARVENARVSRLYLYQTDTFGFISGTLRVNATGDNADNLRGKIAVDSLFYERAGKRYQGDSLRIEAKGQTLNREITLQSKYIDGTIAGNFKFDDLGNIHPYILRNFIPALLQKSDDEAENLAETKSSNKKFDFDFLLKNTSDITEIFYPDISMGENTRIRGYFNGQKDTLNLKVDAKSIHYKDIVANDLELKIENHLDTFDIALFSDKLSLGSGLEYDSVVLHPIFYRDSAKINLNLGSTDNTKNKINLKSDLIFKGQEHFISKIEDLSIWINDTNWRVRQANEIEYRDKYLRVENLKLAALGNYILIDGLLKDSTDNQLNIKLNRFDLKFFNDYIAQYSLNFSGFATGEILLRNVWSQFNYSADFSLNDFVFNQHPMGNAHLTSVWNRNRNAVTIDLKSQLPEADSALIEASGYYYPYKPEEKLKINAEISEFPLAAFEPFVSSFSSKLEGKGTGKISLSGDFAKPIVRGTVHSKVNELHIDYLNTSYSFDETLIFTRDYFGFIDASVHDRFYTKGDNHTALLTFKLHHNYFKDMRLELDVKAKELEMLNLAKHQSELFYGKAFADGHIQILGPFNDLYFNIDVKPLKGTKIAIPLLESSGVQSSEFISFVLKDSSQFNLNPEEEESFNMSMDMRFDMQPEATVQLVMDEKVGDIITANGEGDIRINIDKDFNMDMYGTYKIVKGNYLFTLQNLINKPFTLKPGGSITWDGDMMDAKIDLSAIYKTEARLYDLLQMIDTSDAYKRRSKVNCIINMGGSLATPEIRFDIELPDENNETQEKVDMVLYTSGNSSQDILNKNFISLLMLGTFQSPGGFSDVANPNALASNATEMLSSQVSNWLNKMSDDVDIGFSYDPGDEATSQEIAVALSYQAFNDRLLIDGKFGTGGESKSGESETRIINDINLEYAITKDKNVRAKVFNRTNYEDPLTRKALYTQGAGIVYRKEFDSFADIFNQRKKKKKEKAKANPD